MQLNTILQGFTLALPFLAWLISYGIQQAHWTDKTNSIIAVSTILVAAIITAILGGKLTGNPYEDIMYVLSLATALQAESLAPLQVYLRGHLIPLSVPPVNGNPVTPLATSAYVPTGQAAPPPDVPDIPKRASAPPPPQG